MRARLMLSPDWGADTIPLRLIMRYVPAMNRSGASSMKAPMVSAIVLNWNCGDDIITCVRALQACDYPALSIVVVDNGSTDGSAERVAQLGSVELVRNGRNLGFTGGVNVGLRRSLESGADYAWLMNSDAVPAVSALSRLVEAAEADPGIGLLTPLIRDVEPPHEPSWCLARFNRLSRQIDQTACTATALTWQQSDPRDVIAPGTALLIRRGLIEKIGMLDDTFFAYVEDVDYSLRSTAAGFRNVFVPDAVVDHTFKRPKEDPNSVPPPSALPDHPQLPAALAQASRTGSARSVGHLVSAGTIEPAWTNDPPYAGGRGIAGRPLGWLHGPWRSL